MVDELFFILILIFQVKGGRLNVRLQTPYLHIPTEKALLKMRSPNSLSVGMLNWFVSQQMRTAFFVRLIWGALFNFKEDKRK